MLVLPLAQAAATWHAFSHAETEAASRADGKQAPSLAHCDICLSAAALAGGALVGSDAALPVARARQALPHEAVASVWQARPTPAYQSRAPPISAR